MSKASSTGATGAHKYPARRRAPRNSKKGAPGKGVSSGKAGDQASWTMPKSRLACLLLMINPVFLLIRHRDACRLACKRREDYAVKVLKNFNKEKVHTRWNRLKTFATVMAVKAEVTIRRALAAEFWVSIADYTMLADHFGMFGCNPIPQIYYDTGNLYRMSCVLMPSPLQPAVSADDIHGICVRHALMKTVYYPPGIG